MLSRPTSMSSMPLSKRESSRNRNRKVNQEHRVDSKDHPHRRHRQHRQHSQHSQQRPRLRLLHKPSLSHQLSPPPSRSPVQRPLKSPRNSHKCRKRQLQHQLPPKTPNHKHPRPPTLRLRLLRHPSPQPKGRRNQAPSLRSRHKMQITRSPIPHKPQLLRL